MTIILLSPIGRSKAKLHGSCAIRRAGTDEWHNSQVLYALRHVPSALILMPAWQTQLRDTTPYAAWLQLPGSLTQALIDRCPAFNVLRLRQDADTPHADECEPLALMPGRQAMVREVLLRCAELPLVFAHSVIPLPGLQGPWQALEDLGNRSLGTALFSDPRVQRDPLEFLGLEPHHPLYAKAMAHLAPSEASGRLWARRSRFTLEAHPILVTEVFLPEVLKLP